MGKRNEKVLQVNVYVLGDNFKGCKRRAFSADVTLAGPMLKELISPTLGENEDDFPSTLSSDDKDSSVNDESNELRSDNSQTDKNFKEDNKKKF